MADACPGSAGGALVSAAVTGAGMGLVAGVIGTDAAVAEVLGVGTERLGLKNL
jgi:hypothetical protein